jgi:hypothetical protein
MLFPGYRSVNWIPEKQRELAVSGADSLSRAFLIQLSAVLAGNGLPTASDKTLMTALRGLSWRRKASHEERVNAVEQCARAGDRTSDSPFPQVLARFRS